MNPLASLISVMLALRSDLVSRFNAALANRPPLETVEGANAAAGVLRELDWAKERIERVGTELSATLSAAATIVPGFTYTKGEDVEVAANRLIEEFAKDVSVKAVTEAVTEKKVVRIEDHQAAVDTAVTAAREAQKQELEQERSLIEKGDRLQEIETLASRRSAVVEEIGVAAAASLTDADLLAEDHEDRVSKVKERITTLAAVGITHDAKPLSFTSLMACGYDESGEREFTARLDTIKEHAGTVNLNASSATPKGPATPAGVVSSGSEEKKKVII